MTENHSPILAGYDLSAWERWGARLSLAVPYSENVHWLIVGNSGSGKSYYINWLLRNLLREYRDDVILTFCDFKHSEDFAFMRGYPGYYTGEACADGVDKFYAEYQRVKAGELNDGKLRLLFFDEWAGFQIWMTQQDKKRAEQYKAMVLEVLLMGRSMRCGVTIIMQRNDAAYLQGREQFFVTVAFGKLSPEMKRMIIPGEEIEQRDIYEPGEGIIRSDRFGTKLLKVPRLRSVPKVQQEIMSYLARATDASAAGGGESG